MPAFLDHPGPIPFAHRGGSLDGLENTMAAFERAVALGYRYLETDVRVTADGVLVAFHDETLERLTDHRGSLRDLTWRELRAARVAGREPIPRLAEVLDAWPDARVNVEPKTDEAVDPLVAAIREAGAVERVCVASFSGARVARARAALGPALCTALGAREVALLRLAGWRLLPRRAVPREGDCVEVPLRRHRVTLADSGLVQAAHARGLPVHVWTVNDRAEMRRLLDLGVDGLMTDDVLALRDVLRERGAWRRG